MNPADMNQKVRELVASVNEKTSEMLKRDLSGATYRPLQAKASELSTVLADLQRHLKAAVALENLSTASGTLNKVQL